MKLLKLVPVFLFWAVVSNAQTGQTAQSAQAIKDEDLRKYALTMDSVKVMQETLTKIIAENVQKNTVMTVARYNELFKLTGDQAKLTAANATPEEIAFLKDIEDLRELNISRINTTYQALAKEYVGLKTFNSIKKSLTADQALKTRYESISQEVVSSKQTTAQPAGGSEGQ